MDLLEQKLFSNMEIMLTFIFVCCPVLSELFSNNIALWKAVGDVSENVLVLVGKHYSEVIPLWNGVVHVLDHIGMTR